MRILSVRLSVKRVHCDKTPCGVLPVPQTVKNLRRLSGVFALVSILQTRIMTLKNYVMIHWLLASL